MPRKRSRGTGYLGTDRGLRELYPRLGLDEVSRSTSDEPHNRRKPRLLSAGTPEIVDDAVTNPKIAAGAVHNANINDVHTDKINAGTMNKARLPGDVHYGKVGTGDISGRLGKTAMPSDTVYGNGPGGALAYGQIANTPDLSKYLTSVPKAFVTKRELENALKKYQKKGN